MEARPNLHRRPSERGGLRAHPGLTRRPSMRRTRSSSSTGLRRHRSGVSAGLAGGASSLAEMDSSDLLLDDLDADASSLHYGDVISLSFVDESNDGEVGSLCADGLCDHAVYWRKGGASSNSAAAHAAATAAAKAKIAGGRGPAQAERTFSIRDCLFEVCPALQYTAHKAMRKFELNLRQRLHHGLAATKQGGDRSGSPTQHHPHYLAYHRTDADDEKREKLRREREQEVRGNDIKLRESIDLPVVFGDVVQLRHVRSRKFVTVARTTALHESTSLRVYLDGGGAHDCQPDGWAPADGGAVTPGNAYSGLVVLPRYKVRSLGDQVEGADQIVLQSAKRDGDFLHVCARENHALEVPVSSATSSATQECREVNCTNARDGWRINMFSAVDVRAFFSEIIFTGKPIRIFHSETHSYLSIESTPDDPFYLADDARPPRGKRRRKANAGGSDGAKADEAKAEKKPAKKKESNASKAEKEKEKTEPDKSDGKALSRQGSVAALLVASALEDGRRKSLRVKTDDALAADLFDDDGALMGGKGGAGGAEAKEDDAERKKEWIAHSKLLPPQRICLQRPSAEVARDVQELRTHMRPDSNTLWVLEQEVSDTGGPLNFKTSEFRLRHFNTGRYLAVLDEKHCASKATRCIQAARKAAQAQAAQHEKGDDDTHDDDDSDADASAVAEKGLWLVDDRDLPNCQLWFEPSSNLETGNLMKSGSGMHIFSEFGCFHSAGRACSSAREVDLYTLSGSGGGNGGDASDADAPGPGGGHHRHAGLGNWLDDSLEVVASPNFGEELTGHQAFLIKNEDIDPDLVLETEFLCLSVASRLRAFVGKVLDCQQKNIDRYAGTAKHLDSISDADYARCRVLLKDVVYFCAPSSEEHRVHAHRAPAGGHDDGADGSGGGSGAAPDDRDFDDGAVLSYDGLALPYRQQLLRESHVIDVLVRYLTLMFKDCGYGGMLDGFEEADEDGPDGPPSPAVAKRKKHRKPSEYATRHKRQLTRIVQLVYVYDRADPIPGHPTPCIKGLH